MVDKNLFLYDLAVVAIFKNEGHYLKEWLDYHLLAGVEHFYLYNNDSSDDYKEVLAPYVKENLVTLTDIPGRLMMYPAYDDALDKYRFECRYMAFIDIDEFIFPKTGQSIVELVDEILSDKPHAAGLAINWQCFGSNGLEEADYSKGVLERFTRRAPSDWGSNNENGNVLKKTISNPRLIRYAINPHYAIYFDGKFAVNSNGEYIEPWYGNMPPLSDKIVINHYCTKSKEEYVNRKIPKGSCCMDADYSMEWFEAYDHNEVFDDEILSYRAARAANFSLESEEERISRVVTSFIKTLTQYVPEDMPEEFFIGKQETFLTCRALAEKFQMKIGNKSAEALEEIALVWIYYSLIKAKPIERAEVQMFLRALPEILARPLSFREKIKHVACEYIVPGLCEALKNGDAMTSHEDWTARADWIYIQKLLRLIK